MFRKILVLFVATCVAAALSGCTTVYVNQVLQVTEDTRLHTAYNIWYDDPSEISSVNYHKGKIIPFGTEVEISYAMCKPFWDKDYGKIIFKTKKDGKQFIIRFDQAWILIPLEEFIRRTFTVKNGKELAGNISPALYEKLSKGIVEQGMSRKQVLLAFGYPVPHRTPSFLDDTWIYWDSRMDTVRVVFNKDKVSDILRLEDSHKK
jgi:outer membrane protein assembly factor BamE (lipoprotein component of BamABCDE complex)